MCSDPYCVVSTDGDVEVCRTSVHDRTLSPVWDCHVSVDVDCRRVVALEFQVWDKDMLSSDDIMGVARLPLRDLRNRQSVRPSRRGRCCCAGFVCCAVLILLAVSLAW